MRMLQVQGRKGKAPVADMRGVKERRWTENRFSWNMVKKGKEMENIPMDIMSITGKLWMRLMISLTQAKI